MRESRLWTFLTSANMIQRFKRFSSGLFPHYYQAYIWSTYYGKDKPFKDDISSKI